MDFKKYLFVPFLFFGIAFLIMHALPAKAAVEIPPKDVVLVIDNSKSMIGLGGNYQTQNIFDLVKDELQKVIKNVRVGDTVTLVEFGTDLKVYEKVVIENETSTDRLVKDIENLRATSNWTYTAEMVRSLSAILRSLEQPNSDRVQLAMIFSDAVDDPPPVQGRDRYQLGNNYKETEKCEKPANDSSVSKISRYVYFYSLSKKELSAALANTLFECFPDIRIERLLDKELQMKEALEKLRKDAMANLIPAIDLGAETPTFEYSFKAGAEVDFSVPIQANELASGKKVDVLVSEDLAHQLQIQTDSPVVLREGRNLLNINLSMPLRPEESYRRYLRLTPSSSDGEFFFLPDNKAEIYLIINSVPFTLLEKFQYLPEYYLPLIILLLVLLYVLYQLYKYATFRPVLRLFFWKIEPKKLGLQKQKDQDLIEKELILIDVLKNLRTNQSLEVEYNPEIQEVKYMIDITKMEENQRLVFTASEDVSTENAVIVQMPEFSKNDLLECVKLGKGRKSKLKISQSSLMRLRNRKFFRGLFLKNKTSFQLAGKHFVVESNLR